MLHRHTALVAAIAAPLFGLLLAAGAGAGVDTLVLQGGKRVDTTRPTYEDGVFTTPEAGDIHRREVADWWIGNHIERPTDPSALAATGPDDEDARAIAALVALRQQGMAMATRHPGVAAIQLVDDGEFILTADHRHVYRYRSVGLVLDESQLGWGKITVGFTEGRSRAKIVLARCLTPDNRLLKLAPAAATVAIPSGGEANFDPNSRVLTAAIPGVQVGAVVETAYEFEVYSPEDWRLFFPAYYFQGEIPVRQSTFRILVPIAVKLYWWEDNWNVADAVGNPSGLWTRLRRLFTPSPCTRRQVRLADGAVYREHAWEKTDLPPVVAEPQMPPHWRVVPAVHASIMEDWSYLNQLTGGMQRERLHVTPAIQDLAHALTAGDSSDEGRVATLYHWVQKNIRYISVKASLSSGWAGHPAQQTLDQGYGDCTDKSVLFCALLRALGIAAEPLVLLTNDEGLFAPPYPVLVCNHCITEVHLGDRRVILDCTSQDYRYPAFRGDDHGAFALNFMRGETGMTPVPAGIAAHGKQARELLTINVHGDLESTVENLYTGNYEAGLRGAWKRVPEQIRNPMMQQYLSTIAPGAQLLDFDLGKAEDLGTQFGMRYRYRLPNYLHEAGTYRLLQIPDRDVSFAELSVETRKYPLEYPTSQATRRHTEIQLPESWSVAELPPDTRIANRFFTYTETFRADRDRIVMETFFERKVRRVLPSEYDRYRRTAKAVENACRKPLYLQVADSTRGWSPDP